jgi:hypothetical protein
MMARPKDFPKREFVPSAETAFLDEPKFGGKKKKKKKKKSKKKAKSDKGKTPFNFD